MSILSRTNVIRFSAAAFLAALFAGPAAAAPIAYTRVVFFQTDQNFVAGITTNTSGSGQIWVQAFNAHDPGETITLELLKDGVALPGAISPSTFTDTGQTVYGFPATTPLPITFHYAGSGLQIRATPSGGGTPGLSPTFSVSPNNPARLVALAPGEQLDPGKDPTTSTGKKGTARFQEPNQAFSITVYLTDNWFNPVSANHVVSLASGDLVVLPSGGVLSNGVGTFNVTITGAKTTRIVTVSDDTNPSVAAGAVEVTTAGPPAEEVFPFPSPFNPRLGQSATLRFRMSQAAGAKVTITDQFGQPVWERDVAATAGFNETFWDGRNANGTFVAAGVYYVLLEIDGSVKSRKRIGVVK